MDQMCEVCESTIGLLICEIHDEQTGEVVDHITVCLDCWAGDED